MQETHKKLVLWISRFYVSNKEKKNRFALLLTGFEKGLCSLISSPKEWSRKAGRSFMREIFILNRYQRVSETECLWFMASLDTADRLGSWLYIENKSLTIQSYIQHTMCMNIRFGSWISNLHAEKLHQAKAHCVDLSKKHLILVNVVNDASPDWIIDKGRKLRLH